MKIEKLRYFIAKNGNEFMKEIALTKNFYLPKGREYKLVLAMLSLNDKELLTVYLRRTQTLEEVGKELKVVRERVRQIENKAIQKLKNFLSE